jgi:protein-tyrosine phosphatase
MDDSVELARRLAAEGVRTLAATPHLRPDYPRVVPTELANLCGQLRARLRGEGVSIEIVPAGELDLLWAIEADPEDLELVSFGQRGKDLLVESPYVPLASFFEEQLFQLTVRGYRILLAHPERNPTFQADSDRLRALVERGVLVQLTAASLAASPRTSNSGRTARDLLSAGLAHVIASDSHGSAVPGREALGPGLEVARKLVGTDVDWMITDAPHAILAGEPLPSRSQPQRRRRAWGLRRT